LNEYGSVYEQTTFASGFGLAVYFDNDLTTKIWALYIMLSIYNIQTIQ
jgi:hypothetical protein